MALLNEGDLGQRGVQDIDEVVKKLVEIINAHKDTERNAINQLVDLAFSGNPFAQKACEIYEKDGFPEQLASK